MKLTGGPIAEEQQHVLTEFVADQPGNRRDLGLADTLSLRVGEGDVEDLYSSEARNTFGEGRQFDARRLASHSQADLANYALEVQYFLEQSSEDVCSRIRLGGEEPLDAVLDVDGIVAIADRHLVLLQAESRGIVFESPLQGQSRATARCTGVLLATKE